MVDLGVYNFVKNALAAGKSKEDITADLVRGGTLSGPQIEETFSAVASGAAPTAKLAPDLGAMPDKKALAVNSAWGRSSNFLGGLILLFVILGGLGYFLAPKLSDVSAMLHRSNQQYQASEQQVP